MGMTPLSTEHNQGGSSSSSEGQGQLELLAWLDSDELDREGMGGVDVLRKSLLNM